MMMILMMEGVVRSFGTNRRFCRKWEFYVTSIRSLLFSYFYDPLLHSWYLPVYYLYLTRQIVINVCILLWSRLLLRINPLNSFGGVYDYMIWHIVAWNGMKAEEEISCWCHMLALDLAWGSFIFGFTSWCLSLSINIFIQNKILKGYMCKHYSSDWVQIKRWGERMRHF